jgi:hypothetical protein
VQPRGVKTALLENLQNRLRHRLSHGRDFCVEIRKWISDIPFSLVPSGASAGSAFSVTAEAGALEPARPSMSSKSSKFITGPGAGSGTLPADLDCVVDERVWLVMEAAALGAVRRVEVSSSPASYSSKSALLDVLSRNPLLLPPENSGF